MNQKKRCHVTMILHGAAKSSWVLLFTLFPRLRVSLSIWVMMLIIVVILFYQTLKWSKTWYCFDQNYLILQTGLLFVRKVFVPIDRIRAIRVEQSLFHRLCATADFHVHSGGFSRWHRYKDTIALTLSVRVATQLQETIFPAVSGSFEQRTATVKDHLKNALFQDKRAYFYLLTPTLSAFLGYFLETRGRVFSILFSEGKWMELFSVFSLIFPILITVWLAGFIHNFISNLVSYHRFTLRRDSDRLTIRHGLLTRQRIVIPIRHIHGLLFDSPLPMRLAGLSTPILCAAGYGNQKNKRAFLFPIVSARGADDLLNRFFPEFRSTVPPLRPHRRALRSFLLAPVLVVLSLVFIACLIDIWMSFIFIMIGIPAGILYGLLRYKNASFGQDQRVMQVSGGGLIRNRLLAGASGVQLLKCTQNPFQKRRGVCSVAPRIHRTPASKNMIARHIEIEPLPLP